MACFVVPAAEAVITTVAEKVIKSKEEKEAQENPKDEAAVVSPKVKLSTKLGWLNKLLWGGSLLLAFEHVWHGEVVPWFPFLTAMTNAEDASEMFHEMSTVGVGMAVLVTIVWLGMVVASSVIEKRAAKETPAEGGANA